MVWWCWLLIAACLLVLFTAAAGAGAGLYAVRKIYKRRYNGNRSVKYFTAEDFSGLLAEPVSFQSGAETLRGYLYRRENASGCEAASDGSAQENSGTLIIFSHGFGAGHTSYTTELDRFAREGFWVLGFDNTGCMESGGSMLGGFDRGVSDLLAAYRFAEEDARLKNMKKVFVGHSWGAFSVMNAFPLAEDAVCAVAMCGFDSGADVLAQNIFGRFAPLRAVASLTIGIRSRALLGIRHSYRSSRSLQSVRKPVYLLYGRRDATVRFRWNGRKIIRALSGSPYVRADVFDEKGHNVYLTQEAENEMHAVFGAIAKTAKKDKARAAEMYEQVDYRAITREDGAVMDKVAAFIRSCL